MSFIEDFKKFILRGNVVDLAVAVIIGGAFGKITTSLVNDIIMPPIGMLVGKVNFNSLFVDLSGAGHETLEAAKKDGVPTLNYGAFISTVIDFLIVGVAVYFLVRGVTELTTQLDRLKKRRGEESPAAPTTKECPRCISTIAIKATRCPHCTSEIPA